MDRIKELEELILKKRDEINKIRNEIQDIKLSNFNTHMKGKFLKFGNDMDRQIRFPDRVDYLDSIMRNAIEISKEEFIDGVVKKIEESKSYFVDYFKKK